MVILLAVTRCGKLTSRSVMNMRPVIGWTGKSTEFIGPLWPIVRSFRVVGWRPLMLARAVKSTYRSPLIMSIPTSSSIDLRSQAESIIIPPVDFKAGSLTCIRKCASNSTKNPPMETRFSAMSPVMLFEQSGVAHLYRQTSIRR